MFGEGGEGGMEGQDIGGTNLKSVISSLSTFLNLTKSTSSKKRKIRKKFIIRHGERVKGGVAGVLPFCA